MTPYMETRLDCKTCQRKTSAKVIKVKAKDTIIELKEDRNLIACLAMVCKSRPEIDIQEVVGLYEFTVVPRFLFA